MLKTPSNSKLGFFTQELNLHPIIANYLLNKLPFNKNQIYYFLYGEFYTCSSPFNLSNLRIAIEHIKKGIQEKKSFYIVGDKDVDGTTSIAILKLFLEKIGCTVYYNLPLGEESYGFSERIYEDIYSKKDKIHCVITADCGMKEHEFIKRLKDSNISTIVTDHHKKADSLPEAYITINPHLNEKHFFPLCGAGVVFKLIQGIFLSYTQHYNKKAIFIYLENEQYFYSMTDDIFSPIENIQIAPTVDSLTKILNSLPCEVIVTSIFIKDIILPLVKKTKIKSCLFVEDLYQKYTKDTSKTLNFKKICQREGVFCASQKLLVSLSLLLRKIIFKYQLKLEIKLQRYLEYAFIATVCDRMSLLHYENRSLAKSFFKQLQAHPNQSVLKLVNNNKDIKSLSEVISYTIPFCLGPLINATGRLGKANLSVDFLINPSQENLNVLKSLNQKRQQLQQSALKEINQYISLYPHSVEGGIFIYESFNISKGVTGILASRLERQFNKPCIIIAKSTSKKIGIASSRSSDYNIHQILTNFKHYFEAFGGHQNACGLTLNEDKIALLSSDLKKLSLEDLEVYRIKKTSHKMSLDIEQMTPFFFQSYHKLIPFGEQCEDILFKSQISIKQFSIFGKKNNHLKIISNENSLLEIVLWKYEKHLEKDLEQNKIYDILFVLEYNSFSKILYNAIIQEIKLSE